MKRLTYSAIVLRYVHDQVGGEFANVGLLMYCKDAGFYKFQHLPRTKRIKCFFPNVSTRALRSSLRLASVNSQRGKEVVFSSGERHADLREVTRDAAFAVVANDDSGLQWSDVTVGLTTNPPNTFDRIFEALVLRYENYKPEQKRSDEQVWRTFSKVLEKRSVFPHVQEHQVRSRLETMTFKHAIKNGKLHVLEPVSFDLSTPEAVKDKAKRLLGETMLLRNAESPLKMYYLIGEPASDEVQDAYEQAVKYLKEAPVEKVIYRESQAEQLATDLTNVTRGAADAAARPS